MIPTTLAELISPVHTAVVVVDVQNDFCKEGGVAQKCGRDLSPYPETIGNIERLVKEARKAGVLVVYTQNTTMPNHASDSAESIRDLINRWAGGHVEKIPDVTMEGTWGQQIVNEVTPADRDVVVKKNRSSAFIQTNMDLVLRNYGITTLVVTGFVTYGCVYATAKDGQCLDYFIVVPKDCVNGGRKDLHEHAMALMDSRFDVHPSDKILEVWRNKT